MKPPCIGIIGGIGPLAGVELQRLIIEATPATCDQDHLRVLCFTDPLIPDRTTSLLRNNGDSYIHALQNAAQLLEEGGATVIVIPCNTAHARFEDIQKAVSIPVFNLIEKTIDAVSTSVPTGSSIGVLATDGSLQWDIFKHPLEQRAYTQILPEKENQKIVMNTIYGLKAGSLSLTQASKLLIHVMRGLGASGTKAIILGCTELSLCYEHLVENSSIALIDPLRIAATKLVKECLSKRTSELIL